MAESKTTALAVQSPEQLIAQAIEKGTPVETMERLLAMRRDMKAEWAKEQYDKAMAEFQKDCPTIEKTKKVLNKDKTVRYAYAPIEMIVKQVKGILFLHGFSYTLDTIVEDGWVTAVCKVTHEAGHSDTSRFKVPIDKESFMNQAQKFASALTFAKRYAFCNAFGILTGDEDDGSQESGTVDKKAADFKNVLLGLNRATKPQLLDFKKKIGKSTKYNDEQKKEFLEAVETRLAHLKDLEKSGAAEDTSQETPLDPAVVDANPFANEGQ